MRNFISFLFGTPQQDYCYIGSFGASMSASNRFTGKQLLYNPTHLNQVVIEMNDR